MAEYVSKDAVRQMLINGYGGFLSELDTLPVVDVEPVALMADYIKREDVLEIIKRTSGDYATAFAEVRKLPAENVIPATQWTWT